jgi:hypothetical protein
LGYTGCPRASLSTLIAMATVGKVVVKIIALASLLRLLLQLIVATSFSSHLLKTQVPLPLYLLLVMFISGCYNAYCFISCCCCNCLCFALFCLFIWYLFGNCFCFFVLACPYANFFFFLSLHQSVFIVPFTTFAIPVSWSCNNKC